MKNFFLVLILSLMLCYPQLFAEDKENKDNKDLKYTFSQFGNETVDFIKQPLKWDGGDYLKIGLLSVTSIAIMSFADAPIHDAVQKDHKYYESAPMVIGRSYGSLYSPIFFFSTFAAYSLIADDMKARKIAYEVGQASLYAGTITYLVKVIVGRARPNLNQGPAAYKPLSSLFTEDHHSFPGGHSTAAFTISTVLARNVDSYWLKALCYVPAVMTSASRIYQDWHWTSDNFTGAALGFIVGSWVVDQHEKKSKVGSIDGKQSMLDRIQFQPVISSEFVGLNLSMVIF